MNPFEADAVQLVDPLSPHTRSVRKSLLIASTFGIAIATTGFIPEKVSALGVEFSQADRGSMLLLLSVIIGFLWVSFAVVAATDFTAWRMSWSAKAWEEESQGYEAVRRGMLENRGLTEVDLEELATVERQIGSMWRWAGHSKRNERFQKLVGPVAWSRATIEFAVPLIAGAVAMILLANTSP